MKIKSLFLICAAVLFTSHSFSQELSENILKDNSLASSYNITNSSEKAENSYSRASFNSTLKYKSLQEFINLHIQFPDDARTIGASGAVIAHFEIRSDGSLGEIYFIQSPDPLFSKEVERVLRMAPRFIPAAKNGKIVQSFEQVKINFTLH